MSGHQLAIHGRFRGQRLFLGRDFPSDVVSEGEVARPHVSDQRQPRVQTDHPSVRLLRGVSAQVRLHQRLALLHRNLRLVVSSQLDRRQDILRAWWSFANHHHYR